jgi:hypothetical protein
MVAHARRLYATYGGFSYLGPRLGVPTLAFHSHVNYVHEHLDLAHRVFNRPGMRYSVVSTAEVEPFFDIDAHGEEVLRAA